MSRKRKEVRELQDDSDRLMQSSVRGFRTEGRLTRSNFESVLPFTVNQGEEGTCVYVTLSKLLLFNLMGLVMDITLSEEEQAKLSFLTRLFPIQSQMHSLDKYLKDAMITPESASPKGYALIVLFFYFFDWLKRNEVRAYYFFSDKVTMQNQDRSDFNHKLQKLFGFLKLTTKRLGGQTFSASGWIDAITTRVSPHVADLHWKKVSVCTLRTRFGHDSPTFKSSHFYKLCDILFDITKKFKVMLTVRGVIREKYILHEVMIVGIEGNHLLISNSWGTFLDKVPIHTLPKMNLRVDEPWECLAFQFTFLLPMVTPIDFKTQYDLSDFDEFTEKMQDYLPQMDTLSTLPKIDSSLFDELASRPTASVGGTRKKRYTRFVRLRQ